MAFRHSLTSPHASPLTHLVIPASRVNCAAHLSLWVLWVSVKKQSVGAKLAASENRMCNMYRPKSARSEPEQFDGSCYVVSWGRYTCTTSCVYVDSL